VVRVFPIWMLVALAVSPDLGVAKSLPLSRDSRTPMLARRPHFDLSHFYLASNVGVDWPHKRDAISKGGRPRFDLAPLLFAAAPGEQTRPVRTRAIVLDASPSAQVDDKRGPAPNENLADAFGGLAMPASQRSSAPAVALGDRLLRMGADQMMRDALSQATGAVASRDVPEKLAERRVVSPQIGASNEARDAADGISKMQPAPRLAEAAPPPADRNATPNHAAASSTIGRDVNIAGAGPPPSSSLSGRSIAFDASEGTALDPLLNTTYDLNFPKEVPSLK
jgi:hypothetical protein